MKKLFILPIFILSIMLVLPTVLSWGPNGHSLLVNEVLADNNTQVGRMCSATLENKQAYSLGSVVPDITVTYYYSNGGQEYRATHNWNFQQECTAQALTDDEKCLCEGIIAHLIADSVSHNTIIPTAIETYYLPNWITHPLLEKKYDSTLIIEHPELLTDTPHLMDALDGIHKDRYIQMIQKSMGSNSNIKVGEELVKLRVAISGVDFYNTQFTSAGISSGYIYIDKFTNYIAPYTGEVNLGGVDNAFNKAEESIENVFNNPGSKYQISPHGFDDLNAADAKIGNSLTYILLACIGIPIVLAFRKPGRKYKWWLLAIPSSIIALVLIVYTLL